jgi:hypothetical protein
MIHTRLGTPCGFLARMGIQVAHRCSASHTAHGNRMIGSWTSHKVLSNCFKLHIHESYLTFKVLTRGFFEVEFSGEKDARAT